MITINDMDGYNDAVTDINQKILKEYQQEIIKADAVRNRGGFISSQVARLFATVNETKRILEGVRAT